MKGWIKLLIMVGSKVTELYQTNERCIKKESLRMDKSCGEMVEIIHELNERKRRIINLAVLFRVLKEGLTSEEFDIIRTDGRCLDGRFIRRTSLRKTDRVYIKAERIVHNLGFDEGKLGRDYPGYAGKAGRMTGCGG